VERVYRAHKVTMAKKAINMPKARMGYKETPSTFLKNVSKRLMLFQFI